MLSLKIALRYLLSRKSHNAVNIISMVSLAGIAVATMAIVCVLSVFNGFSDLAHERMSSLNSDLRITPVTGKTIAAGDSLAAALEQIDGVIAAEPVIAEQGLATFADRQMPVKLIGVTPRWRNEVVTLDSIIIDANDAMLDYGVTASVGVAIKLGATPGFDRLALYVPRRLGRVNPANPLSAFRADTTFVAAVFQSQQSDIDSDIIFMPLDELRQLLDYDTEATSIMLRFSPDAKAVDVKEAVISAIGPSMKAADRLQQQEASSHMIEIEKWISFVMLGFILLIASFNVISTLSMLIIEKRASMDILAAMGATGGMRSRIFMWQGMLISAIGGVIGLIAGSALTLAQQWGGFIKLGGDHSHMSITVYPVHLLASDLLATGAIVLCIGTIVAVTARAMSRR